MSVSELKKVLEQRKIDGRSKLVVKSAMIEVLEYVDANPEDKAGLKEFMKKYNKLPKPESETVSKPASETKSAPKSETKAETKETSSGKGLGKGGASRHKKPKKERPEMEGINREEYPPGTRFVSRGGKIHVHYPKNHMSHSHSDSDPEKTEILSIPSKPVELVVKKVPSKSSQEPDDLDEEDQKLRKSETKSKPASKPKKPTKPASKPKQDDPDATEEEDPKVIEQKRKELQSKKKIVMNEQTNKISAYVNDGDDTEEDVKTLLSKTLKRTQEKITLFGVELDETEKEPHEPEPHEPLCEEPEYISSSNRMNKQISDLCMKMTDKLKHFDLNNSEVKDKKSLIKALTAMNKELTKYFDAEVNVYKFEEL
jgi:hypothetical protein